MPFPRATVVIAVAVMAAAITSATAASEHYSDPVGDAIGAAPDIVAVTVDEPEGPVLRISVEFSEAPSHGTGEIGSDVPWLVFDTDPDVSFPELDGYSITVLGLSRPEAPVASANLMVGDELYWHVVDVDAAESTIAFRVDRKLLGDPDELYFRIYSAALEETLYTEQIDLYPEDGEPPAVYVSARDAD